MVQHRFTSEGRHRSPRGGRRSGHLAGAVLAAVSAVLYVVIAPTATAEPVAATSGLWSRAAVPASSDVGRGAPAELGTVFVSRVSGYVRGVEFYKSSGSTGRHKVSLWTRSGKRLAQATTRPLGHRERWVRVTFDRPVKVRAGVTYVASYHSRNGHFGATRRYFADAHVHGPLRATMGMLGHDSSTFPAETRRASYFVDVVFSKVRGDGQSAPKPAPPQSGWPNASNTGVPAGTALTPMSGTLTVSKAGTVVDAKDINGCIAIKASNVTIKRTRVSGEGCVNSHQIDTGDGQYTGILIEDVEVDGKNTSSFGAGIGNSGFTCRRCNIHNVGQGVHIDDDATIEYSFIHDLYGQGDPANGGSHNEPIFAGGGSNLVIRGNELRATWAAGSNGGGMSAALALYGWLAPQNNVLVDHNRFSSAEGFCVYGGATHDNPNPTDVRFTDNRFVRGSRGTCGEYGPVTAYKTGSGNVWTGNLWDDTGATIQGRM